MEGEREERGDACGGRDMRRGDGGGDGTAAAAVRGVERTTAVGQQWMRVSGVLAARRVEWSAADERRRWSDGGVAAGRREWTAEGGQRRVDGGGAGRCGERGPETTVRGWNSTVTEVIVNEWESVCGQRGEG